MGYSGVSGDLFCLKSWSIRLHVNFPLRPKWTSDSFWTAQGWIQTQKKTQKIVRDSKKTRSPMCRWPFFKNWPFFGEKWTISEMSTATGRQAEPNTQTSPRIHPDKLQLTHYVGPPPRRSKKQEDVIQYFSRR